MAKRFFTSESVTEGHPDKVCDQISDAILDEIIKCDPNCRVACECAVSTGFVMILGEITTNSLIDYSEIARKTIKDIGYDDPSYGFCADSCCIITSIKKQSPDIALGVNASSEYKRADAKDMADLLGAGDQGMMFGYACNETPGLMPAPIAYAHKIAQRLALVRKEGLINWLRPDGKVQVTIEYDESGMVERVSTIVVSAQHSPDVNFSNLREGIIECVIKPVFDEKLIDKETNILINPTGRFVIGGPAGDSGLTGRKIIVDTYGGAGGHGGGAFSGKDPTKVDRSGAYMARYVAKNIVASGLAKYCQVGISYAIGVAHPISIAVDTFGTGVVPDEKLAHIIMASFDFRPSSIIDFLALKRPIYKRLASYGHFGRTDLDVSWEATDAVESLLSKV